MDKLKKIYQKLTSFLKWFVAFSKKQTLNYIYNAPNGLNDEEFDILEKAYLKHKLYRSLNDQNNQEK
uniref:Uncharacterized protein n=1 Tax=Mycoplasma anserisalpingitidis TaxID=519450 RepID=A0A8F2E4P9_9MOLU|nr:hypothetical protein [Mycoplasma anserisalpingitidis]